MGENEKELCLEEVAEKEKELYLEEEGENEKELYLEEEPNEKEKEKEKEKEEEEPFPQKSEGVATAVAGVAKAVWPLPSIVFSSNSTSSSTTSASSNSSSSNGGNRTLENLQRHITRVWRQGFSKESRKGFFNPEHLTSQKRQWTQLQMQMLERKKWSEPSSLFEHMVVVGIHAEAETQELEEALLKRRIWERDLDAPEHLRDVMRQQFRGMVPPVPEPQILFQFPPGKGLPMRQNDLLSFCFPGGVEAHLVERTPSLSELNEIIYSQDHIMRDDLSFIFLLKVADNATLYGVCIYVPEFVKEPPGITRLYSNKKHRHGPKPLGRFSLSTYRCYCLLTKLPFFDLHFKVLNSIITQERLDRITERVDEMTVDVHDDGEGIEILEVSEVSPLNLEESTEKIEQSVDFSLPEVSNVGHYPERSSSSSTSLSTSSSSSSSSSAEEEQSDSKPTNIVVCNGCDALEENTSDSVPQVISAQEKSNGGSLVASDSMQNKQVASVCDESLEELNSSLMTESSLQRAESLETTSRRSVNSEDDYGADSLSEVDNHLLQILHKYYNLPVPARGSSFSFQPSEHLPPLNFERPVNETLTMVGGRISQSRQYQSILGAVEVQNSLASMEEAAAISIWTVATLCRVLSLENVLALFTCVLLEKQIVVVCPNAGVLSAVVLSIIPLLRPFQWQSLVLPILPNQMLDFLDAPVPYIVGVLQKSSAVRAKSSSVVIVHVQRDKVSMPYTPSLPHRKELTSALQPYHTKLAAESNFSRRHPVHVYNSEQSYAAEGFLSVVRNYLESLCENLRSHTITNVQSNNDKVSLLLKNSFVEDFESKDHPFMKLFVDTQLFSVYTDAVLSSIEST